MSWFFPKKRLDVSTTSPLPEQPTAQQIAEADVSWREFALEKARATGRDEGATIVETAERIYAFVMVPWQTNSPTKGEKP